MNELQSSLLVIITTVILSFVVPQVFADHPEITITSGHNDAMGENPPPEGIPHFKNKNMK